MYEEAVVYQGLPWCWQYSSWQTDQKKKSLISGAYILMESHRKPPNQESKIHSIWDADELLEEKYLRMNEA